MPALDYVSIVRSVYTDRRAMIVGAAGCVLCTCATGYVTGSYIMWVIAAGFIFSGAARFLDMARFQKAKIGPTDVEAAARWEVRATYHAAIFAFLCGAWCFASLVFVNNPFSELLSLVATVACRVGIKVVIWHHRQTVDFHCHVSPARIRHSSLELGEAGPFPGETMLLHITGGNPIDIVAKLQNPHPPQVSRRCPAQPRR